MFLLLAILYFATRLINLTLMPVFVDEAIYIHWSQIMWNGNTLRFISLNDGKQPLFMLLTIPSLALFQDPLFAGRFISVLSGFLTLAGIYLLTKKYFDSNKARIATLIYIITPFTLFYDRLSVVDGLLSAFGVWSLYLSLEIFISKKSLYSLILGILFGLALWTKTPGTFFIILTFLAPFLKFTKADSISYWGKWLTSSVIGILIYNLLRFSKGFWLISKRNSDYVYNFQELLQRKFLDPLIPNLFSAVTWVRDYLTMPIAAACLLAIVYVLIKRTKLSLYILMWFIAPVMAGALISKAFTARYILICIFPLIILLSVLVSDLIDQLKKKLSLKITTLFLVLSLIPAFKFDYYLLTNVEKAPIPQRERSGYLEEWSSGYGIKEVSNFLIDQAKKNSFITAMTEGYVGTLPDGINIYTKNYKNIEAFGIGWPVGSFPADLQDYLNKGKVYLVVNQSRMKLPDTANLVLISKYPKPASTNERDYLLLYEVIRKN